LPIENSTRRTDKNVIARSSAYVVNIAPIVIAKH
jgi:hypothetical protein